MIALSTNIRKIHPWLCDKVGRQVRRFTLNYIERVRLKNRDFSVLSQNCVGSIWYHDLGLKFTSPTINMKFNGNDWVDFLEDYDTLVNAPIQFIDSPKPYPVGLIDGRIYVEFVHYHSQNQAVTKWNIRKGRVLPIKVVLGFDEGMDDTHIFRFLNMEKFPNRLLFIDSNRAYKLGCDENPHAILVSPKIGGAKLLNFCSLMGHRFYQRHINYVEYINRAISNDPKQD